MNTKYSCYAFIQSQVLSLNSIENEKRVLFWVRHILGTSLLPFTHNMLQVDRDQIICSYSNKHSLEFDY